MKLKEKTNFRRRTSNDDLRFYRNRNLSNSKPLPPIQDKNGQSDPLKKTIRDEVEGEIHRMVNEGFLGKTNCRQSKMDDHSTLCTGVDRVANVSIQCLADDNTIEPSPWSKFVTFRNEPDIFNNKRMLTTCPILPPIQPYMAPKSNSISRMKNNIESNAISQTKNNIETQEQIVNIWKPKAGYDTNGPGILSPGRIKGQKGIKTNAIDISIESSVNAGGIATISQNNLPNNATLSNNNVPNIATMTNNNARNIETNITTKGDNNAPDIATISRDCAPNIGAISNDCVPDIATTLNDYAPGIATISNIATILKDCEPNIGAILKDYVPSNATISKDNVPNIATISKDYVPSNATISKDYAPSSATISKDNVPNIATISKDYAPSSAPISKDHVPTVVIPELEEVKSSYLWKSKGLVGPELSVTVYEDSSVQMSTTIFKEDGEDDNEQWLSVYMTKDSNDIPEFKALVYFLNSENARRRNGVCMDMDEKMSNSLLEFNRTRTINAMFQL